MHVKEKGIGGASACAISPDGARIVVGFNEGLIKAYSTQTGKRLFTYIYKISYKFEIEGWMKATFSSIF